jgi:hypothetical protein
VIARGLTQGESGVRELGRYRLPGRQG